MTEWMRFEAEPKCPLVLIADGRNLKEIHFGDSTPGSGKETDNNPLLKDAAEQLRLYFAGDLRRFDLPLAPEGTAFQRRVWDALLTVPYGETCSYSALAKQIGSPAAVRAVGAANGRNPIPIVIPCHRVIGASGKLTGFGGGLPLKKFLLDRERFFEMPLR